MAAYDITAQLKHPETFDLSAHARKRMAQRNLCRRDIAFILIHGTRFHRAGAIFVHLRRKDIPATHRSLNAYSRLEGTTVVLSRDEPTIMTLWRNRQRGLRHIQQKYRNSSK